MGGIAQTMLLAFTFRGETDWLRQCSLVKREAQNEFNMNKNKI